MSKRTITRLWIIGLIVIAIGLVVGGVSIGLMFGLRRTLHVIGERERI